MNNDKFEDRISFETENLNSTKSGLGIGELGINSKEGAQESLAVLDNAINQVSGQQSLPWCQSK